MQAAPGSGLKVYDGDPKVPFSLEGMGLASRVCEAELLPVLGMAMKTMISRGHTGEGAVPVLWIADRVFYLKWHGGQDCF